jgi:Cu/Ag efflux pump CusA
MRYWGTYNIQYSDWRSAQKKLRRSSKTWGLFVIVFLFFFYVHKIESIFT